MRNMLKSSILIEDYSQKYKEYYPQIKNPKLDNFKIYINRIVLKS